MQFEVLIPRPQFRPLAHRLLDTVFPKTALASLDHRNDVGSLERFAHRNEANVIPPASGGFGRNGNAFANFSEAYGAACGVRHDPAHMTKLARLDKGWYSG